MEKIAIFLNNDACSVDDIFLKEDNFKLVKLFRNIYKVNTSENLPTGWLIKTYESKELVRHESIKLNRLKTVNGVPTILATGMSKNFNYNIMSLQPGKDLLTYLNKFGIAPESRIKKIIKSCLVILKDIHSVGLVHGDIKIENIIYDKATEKVSIIDFEGKCTIGYRSPEQILSHKITNKTDIWSLGVVTYILAYGFLPFENDNESLNKNIEFDKYSKNFRDFLRCVLERNVENRYDCDNCLSHEWLN